PAGRVGLPYSVTLTASGGTPPYVWEVSGLPDGLDIDPTSGQVIGTPQAGTEGDHTIDVAVVHDRGDRAATELDLDVGPPPFTMITAYGLLTCGIDILGDAFCWGYGWLGQLGNGSSANHSIPQAVSGDLDFTHITAGSDHTCGITTAGDTYCW